MRCKSHPEERKKGVLLGISVWWYLLFTDGFWFRGKQPRITNRDMCADELTEKEENVKISVDTGRFIRPVEGMQMPDYRV